ncbi:hypothetical protein KJ632_03530 [Patescibacteria group bacterium]|nr:hypothetical protein [Patescibacteria group bacterium]
MKKITALTLTLLLACACSIIKPPINYDDTPTLPTENEMREKVESYIMEMEQYKNGNGYHLEEIGASVITCPACWDFEYEFRLQDAQTAEVTGVADVKVSVRAGKITGVFYQNDQIQVPESEPAPKPDVDEADVAEPDVAEPDVAEPDVAEPEVAEPEEAVEPEVTEPEVTEPAEQEA